MMVPSISKIVLKSKIKKASLVRIKNFLAWEKVNRIALIIESEPSFSKHDLDTFVEQSQKYMEVYFIQPSAQQATYADWNCLTRKQKSIFGLPNKLIEKEISSKKFDLVINCCKQNNLFAIALSNAALATLNCGTDKSYNETDLIITRLNGQKLMDYIQNIVSYLKMIKT